MHTQVENGVENFVEAVWVSVRFHPWTRGDGSNSGEIFGLVAPRTCARRAECHADYGATRGYSTMKRARKRYVQSDLRGPNVGDGKRPEPVSSGRELVVAVTAGIADAVANEVKRVIAVHREGHLLAGMLLLDVALPVKPFGTCQRLHGLAKALAERVGAIKTPEAEAIVARLTEWLESNNPDTLALQAELDHAAREGGDHAE